MKSNQNQRFVVRVGVFSSAERYVADPVTRVHFTDATRSFVEHPAGVENFAVLRITDRQCARRDAPRCARHPTQLFPT